MKNFLLVFIAFSITATVGLMVTAKEKESSQKASIFAVKGIQVSKELPPLLPEIAVIKTTVEVQAHSVNHYDCCNAGYGGPGFVQGQPLRNILRWIFRPRLRRSWRCR